MKLKRFLSSFLTFSLVIAFAIYFLKAAPNKTLYWETPVPATNVDSRFPQAISDNENLYVFFEEVDKKSEKLWISMIQRKENELKWSNVKKIAGPFSYSGEDIPDIFSATISKTGKIALSVLTSTKSIGVYISSDKCKNFSFKEFSEQQKAVVGPKIFATSTGGFMIFASLGENADTKSNLTLGRFSMLYSKSSDGITWTELDTFEPSATVSNPFVPYLAEYEENGKTGDIVLFQGFTPSNAVFQIFMTKSFDEQKTWSEATAITNNPQYRNQRPTVFTTYDDVDNSDDIFDSEYNFGEEDNEPLNFDSDAINANIENQIENEETKQNIKNQINKNKKKKTYITWERNETKSDHSQIMFAELNDDGTLTEEYEITSATNGGNAHRPTFFKYAEKLSLVWFDDRKGVDGIYMSQRNGKFWTETNLVSLKNNSVFAQPLLIGDEIAFVWQQELNKDGDGRLYVLETDRTVQKPKIIAKSFKEGKRSTSEKAQAKVQLPTDSSGIAGYTWIWTQNKREEPPKDLSKLRLPSNTTITDYAPEDGIWYFKARAYDYAGNWSESATLTYHRDLTPPQPPIIHPIEEDKYGFASTNDFFVSWENDDHDDDIAGYSWNITPIGTIDKNLMVNKTHPMKLSDSVIEKKISDVILKYTKEKELKKWVNVSRPPRVMMGTNTSTSYKNPENGLYIFSVCAIDEVGNIGEPADYFVILNKYIPSTKIFNVNQKTDEYGVVSISITGQGFLYDGTISKVTIESKNNKYDFSLQNNDYKVTSDERITGIKLNDMKAGRYTVTIHHTDRGKCSYKSSLIVSDSGIVRHENRYFFEPTWRIFKEDLNKYIISSKDIPFLLILLLSILAILGAIAGLSKTARESIMTQHEIKALLSGGKMTMENKTDFLQKGVSLKTKLLMFTSILIIAIVTIVAVSLGKRLSQTQEQTLLTGLQNRVDVVMESISSGVRNYLPEAQDKTNEIMLLPSQTKYFAEANYATITGLPSSNENTNLDYVWSSNDPNIESKIDTKEMQQGISRLSNPNERIFGIADKLNEEAIAQVTEISARMEVLKLEKETADEKRNEELNNQLAELIAEIDSKLNELSTDASSSIPQFNAERLDRNQDNYMFYKPVMFRQSGDNTTFVRSFVMMEVSTDNVKAQIDKAIREIIIISVIVAIIAIILGNLGALFVASIIVNPIRKLVIHVKKIGETKDKEELEGEEIKITSHDEIRTLGDAVNEMTVGLVQGAKDEKAAKRLQEENIKQQEETIKTQKKLAIQQEETIKAQKETQALQEQMLKAQEAALKDKLMNSDGRLIQTCYVPLNDGKDGRTKDTIATYKDSNVDLYCYYEGSDDLSGDYFGYKQLENGFYAVMKCDVSGHGVPASLITSVLAVSFNSYFENWSLKKNGTRLNELAVNLNDSIGQLNLKGKFATLLIALFDSKNDCVYLCHAGDNIVRFYDSKTQSQKTLTLKEAGAAGAIKRDLYEMMGMDISTAYNVIKYPLKKNDILFLYTDGIEESQSKFKDKNFNNILKGADSNEFEYEEFSNERIKDVVETYFKKGKYVLKREHPQNPNEHLEFDFASCSGEIDDMILALSSIEKVFRFYKKPNATGDVEKDAIGNGVIHGNAVRVDRRIDEFLKRTFNMYDYYCSNQKDIDVQNYIYYLNIDEDKQEDDLTIYAIKNVKK